MSELVTTFIPISYVFMLGDSVHATIGGIMRGLDRQRLVLFLNILAFWILAIPVGSLLTFVGNAGIAPGMWWGYVIGIYSEGIVGVTALKNQVSWEEEALKAAKCVSALSSYFQGESLVVNVKRPQNPSS